MAKRKKKAKKAKRARKRTRRVVKPVPEPTTRFAPLNTTFLISSIIGFFISAIYLPKYSISWAFSFSFVFVLMFIAAMLSMTRAAPDAQLLVKPRKIK